MRIGIFTSQIRQARKSRVFSTTPDFVCGAAAVLATFAFQAFFHQPTATLSSPKTNILLPAVPPTSASPLPPSKTTTPPQNQNASMCTLAAGGLVVLIVLAASASRVFHYSTPSRRRHSIATSHGGGGDDPDPTPPPRTCPDDTNDAQDAASDDEAEVEALLTGDALEMDTVEDLLVVVDDDGEEDPNDPPPPDDPPPPASTTATPDDPTPPRANTSSSLRLWLAAFCAALADSLTHALADWLRQKTLAPLVDTHRRLRLRGVLVTNVHPCVPPRALYNSTTPADSVSVPPSPTTPGLSSDLTIRAIYHATNPVPPTLRAQRTQHAPPSTNMAPHAKLILMVGAVLGNVCALVVTVLCRFSWRERKEKG
ncbi:hypothetical protein C0992_004548, partial [Termitomyces sp. T32_za158]